MEQLINKVFGLLKDTCGRHIGDSGKVTVLQSEMIVQEKLDHSVKTQIVLMTTTVKWVSGIEGRLSMLDVEICKKDLPYGAPFSKLYEKIQETESRLNSCRKPIRESNAELE